MTAPSNTFILGVDLDEVVLRYISGFRVKCAEYLDRPLSSFGPATSWSFAECGWVQNIEEYLALHARAVRDGLFAELDMMPGASEALWELSDAGVYIRIITHRLGIKGNHAKAVADTVTSLEKHNVPYRDLCFVANKPDVGAHMYFDDAPHNILALRAAGKHAVVFDSAESDYNRHLTGPRAFGWADAKDQVLKYKAELGL